MVGVALEDWAVIFALAEGRIPDGMDPESAEGRLHTAMAAKIAADLAVAPKMTAAQKALVVTLLRGAGDDHAA